MAPTHLRCYRWRAINSLSVAFCCLDPLLCTGSWSSPLLRSACRPCWKQQRKGEHMQKEVCLLVVPFHWVSLVYIIIVVIFASNNKVSNAMWWTSSHSATAMKHSEASVFTVADLAELFTEDSDTLEWDWSITASQSGQWAPQPARRSR